MAGKYSLLLTARTKSRLLPGFIRARWPKGCQGGVTNALILGISTLILNITIACWLSAASGSSHNLVTMERRSCKSSRNIITIAELIINVLATLLLATSNYCMQILSSPLREEVDAAHAANKWLCIGVSNFKNLHYIPWTRRLLLLTLAVSSLPVHLLWNSAIILELPTNDYLVAAVSEEFVSGALFDADPYLSSSTSAEPFEEMLESMKHNGKNLTAAECITTYSKPFISEYSNLALVTNVHNSSQSLLGLWVYHFRRVDFTVPHILSTTWPCGIFESTMVDKGDCNLAKLAASNATHWSPFYMLDGPVNVTYCLAQRTQRACNISLTPIIVWIVLAANLSKVVCFCGTLILVRKSSKQLITTGDTVQSFLSKPDPKLSQRCLSNVSQIKRDLTFWTSTEMPLQWLPKHQVGLCGASLSLWLSLFLPAVTSIGYVIYRYIHNDLSSFLSFGFSSTNKSELVFYDGDNLNHGVVANSLLANTPQVILSYIYTAYNAVLTSMLSHSEMLRYSTKRRGLRVTQPTGMQRSSYYLSLPYRFSIPLITASAVLHWLVSESFFLVRVIAYAPDGTEDRGQLISVGYSSYAIIVSLAMMVFMLLAILCLGLGMRYSATMPLVATCSASIAAICQPAPGTKFEPELATMPLKWGSVDHDPTSHSSFYYIRHATFSSGRVSPLIRGEFYK